MSVFGIARVMTAANTLSVRRFLSRAGVSGLDQAVASLTNFGVVLAAGRLLGSAGLGMIVICTSLSYAVIGLTRALAGEPILVFGPAFRDGAIGSALLVGGLGGTLSAAVAFTLSPAWRDVLLVLAALLPLLAIQDTARYVFFSDKRPSGALASDSVWALAQGVAIVTVASTPARSAALVMATWGVGIAAGAAYGWFRLRPQIRLRATLTWLRESRALSGWLAAQVAISQAAGQLSLMAVGAVAGLATVGALRAGQTLFAPLFLVASILPVLLLPTMRAQDGSDTVHRRVCLTTAIAGVGACVYIAAIGIGGGGGVFALVFGEKFQAYGPLLVPLALAAAMQVLAIGPGLGSRSLKAGRAIFLTQAAATILGFPALLGLAAIGNATGAAWGLVVQASVLCAASWATYQLVRRAS